MIKYFKKSIYYFLISTQMIFSSFTNEYNLNLDVLKKSLETTKSPEIKAKSYLLIGYILDKEKKYDEAIEAFKKAIKINPRNDISYYNIGHAYNNKREYNKAIEAYKKAIKINPKFDIAYYNMGMAYYFLNKLDKAIDYYIKALKINPNKNSAYINLFELQLTQNQPFNQILEIEYRKRFRNQKEIFIKYEMLKILRAIINRKETNLEEWKQKYRDVSLGGWSFNELNAWVAKMNEKEVKKRLVEALAVFKGHKI